MMAGSGPDNREIEYSLDSGRSPRLSAAPDAAEAIRGQGRIRGGRSASTRAASCPDHLLGLSRPSLSGPPITAGGCSRARPWPARRSLPSSEVSC